MLTAVDHILARVGHLGTAVETYRRLGFTLRRHEDVAYAVFGDFYIEFRESVDLPGWGPYGWAEGLYGIALRSDDLDAEVARLRSNGLSATDPVDHPVDGRAGSLSRRTVAVDAYIPVSLVQHHHDSRERLAYLGGPTPHSNTVTTLERTYIAVESIDRELESFERVLGVSAPEPELGTVIMSLMSVFYVGDIGIAVAEPRGPGPTADALSANGPGMFQVLFRAGHLDQAEEFMVDNGMPAPTRGTRLSGESALLVGPEIACNIYVALAGEP